MQLFLAGRLVEGFGGGALVSLAFVSVERLFSRAIWPQLFGIMSAIWGVAAFSGPMLGAIMTELLSWRWAFGIFTFGGAAMALASVIVLNTPEATRPQATSGRAPPFPFIALGCLAVAVVLIASAGVDIALLRSSLLMVLGGLEKAIARWNRIDGVILAIQEELLTRNEDLCRRLIPPERLAVGIHNDPERMEHWLARPVRHISTDRPDLALDIRRRLAGTRPPVT